jgi:hypothetical protein
MTKAVRTLLYKELYTLLVIVIYLIYNLALSAYHLSFYTQYDIQLGLERIVIEATAVGRLDIQLRLEHFS